ncbi:hypothetical protein GGF46_000501 [Coemansia sp. RSA 552]|nr:hypothetical protein GGF46_000501 [Coemansia sp. RSA 552]
MEEEYEVESIVGDKVVDGEQFFLLKWKGYAAEWNTWEPEANLACPSIVAGYWKKKKMKKLTGKYAVGFDPAEIFGSPKLHRLRVVNTVDKAQLPTTFTYIDGYVRSPLVPRPSAVTFPCSCRPGAPCGEDCDCMPVPYYDENGLLCTDYPGPISECSDLCECSADCPNRVVQRGNVIDIDIFRTGAKGWGALTRKAIRKGEYVCRYTGELLSSAEAERRNVNDTTYLFDLDREVPTGKQAQFTIDARSYGNVSHFFNHSCDPNMVIRAVYINHLDPRLHELAFFAIRDIGAGEELTFDYSPSSTDGPPLPRQRKDSSMFDCHCGASDCRRHIF